VDSVPILSCYQCPAGTTSSGGVCYLCPESTTSEVGGTCKPITESSETPTALVPTLTPVIDISETATPSATMSKATCNPWAASVMEHRPYDGTCSFSGKGTCMPGSLILYDEKTDITTCVTTSFYWISSCPSGYYLDDKTGACVAPSKKTGCFGYSLTESELSSCYPTGCLAGSSLDTDLQCCQSNPSDTDSNDSCVQFTVQVPACGDSPSGGNAGGDDEPPSPPSCSVEPNNPYCVP
jgi:hypothetical protein